MTDTTTALAFLIPTHVDDINAIRSSQDRAYPRWMPHINFIFPFVPVESFDQIKEKLDKAFSSSNFNLQKHEIIFDSIDYFKQSKGATFHLKPSKASEAILEKVFEIISTTLPEIKVKHDKFTAHCTIAQCEKKDIESKQNELNAWFNTKFGGKLTVHLDKICMIKRSPESNDQMVIIKEVSLIPNQTMTQTSV
jgi:2'-5' RNA ligase